MSQVLYLFTLKSYLMFIGNSNLAGHPKSYLAMLVKKAFEFQVWSSGKNSYWGCKFRNHHYIDGILKLRLNDMAQE